MPNNSFNASAHNGAFICEAGVIVAARRAALIRAFGILPCVNMTKIDYRDWTFDCDVESTRRAYESILAGGVETCSCSGCRNFLAQRQLVFPEEVINLFGQLGINYKRDAEIYHTARIESGLHLYGGWFHFIGNILKQPDVPAKLNGHFTVDFIVSRSLAAESFGNQPLVQVEITAEVPWILKEEKEPD